MPHDPCELVLVRHGQSLGNVARDAAHARGDEALELADRDMDVPLSDLGVEQSAALGRWFATQSAPPTVVISSPYVRAVQTAETLLQHAALDCRVQLDERLREREFGILDLLTTQGIRARFPAEAMRRERLGKFYHRPPGGESWVDVALRVRSLRDSIAREHLDQRVLMVTHEVVVVIWRYLLDQLDEARTLALSRERAIANCSVTRYRREDDGELELDLEGWVAPLEREAVAVTRDHDAPVASR
jgi:broad specificity phosphatase PhoE